MIYPILSDRIAVSFRGWRHFLVDGHAASTKDEKAKFCTTGFEKGATAMQMMPASKAKGVFEAEQRFAAIRSRKLESRSSLSLPLSLSSLSLSQCRDDERDKLKLQAAPGGEEAPTLNFGAHAL